MTTQLQGPVRVRFAPSPTGFLHVGGARTAIYNEQLRRSLGGANILRIEDTDQKRSDAAMIEQILGALAWLGVEVDEGPFLQSASVDAHRDAADRLLAEGKAYACFRTQEEMDERRREVIGRGDSYRYRTSFAPPSADEVTRRVAAGERHAVRLRMPDEAIRFQDLVRGDVEFPAEALDDFIILRSDGTPTYHLSVVCDDIAMRVSHVVRGEDHLSNVPKHIALFLALGAEVPAFAHLPLILGPDRKRLSKRTGAASVEEFREQGILPQALYNYLALLGWSPGEDRELMTRDEMTELFTAERLGTTASIFDRDKLAWMNAQYMSSTPLDELVGHLEPFLAEAGLADADRDRLLPAVDLHRRRSHDLRELAEGLVPYFERPLAYDLDACTKFRKQADLPAHVDALAERYAAVEPFDIDATDAALRALAEELGVKAGVLIHPTRMALTASKAGPPLFDVVAAMGREPTLERLRDFAAFLRRYPLDEQPAS